MQCNPSLLLESGQHVPDREKGLDIFRQSFPAEIERVAARVPRFHGVHIVAVDVQDDMHVLAVRQNVLSLFLRRAYDGVGSLTHGLHGPPVVQLQVVSFPRDELGDSTEQPLGVPPGHGEVSVDQGVDDLGVAPAVAAPRAQIAALRDHDDVVSLGGPSELERDVAFSRVITEPAPVSGVAQIGAVGNVSDSQVAQIHGRVRLSGRGRVVACTDYWLLSYRVRVKSSTAFGTAATSTQSQF